MKRPGRSIIAAVVIACGLAGCDANEVRTTVGKWVRVVSESLPDDLEAAREAYEAGEWERAEKLLERFLRTSPDKEERWEAWITLLQAAERSGQDRRWIGLYLEAMLVEFERDPERLRFILFRMGEVQESERQYDQAVSTWLQYVALPGISDAERHRTYTRLATIQMRLNRLQGAEDTLHECLSLPLADSRKSECMYLRAELDVLREAWDDGATTLLQIMEIEDVPPIIRSRSVFLLADIYEQQGQLREALELFETILKTYPNPLAVEVRIAALRERVPNR